MDLNNFEQEWQPTEQECKAAELAKRYHNEAEAYDRTVCTGPMLDGAVMPATPVELAKVNANAHKLRRQVMAEAAAAGISAADMSLGISRHVLRA